MFYSASKNTFEKARLLRNNMTEAEKILWDKLKDRKIFKSRFRRQHPISIFIVDFYCHEFRLAIEVDGGIHLNKEIAEYDDGRTCDLEKFGIIILRFRNDKVLNNLDFVLHKILLTISSLNPL